MDKCRKWLVGQKKILKNSRIKENWIISKSSETLIEVEDQNIEKKKLLKFTFKSKFKIRLKPIKNKNLEYDLLITNCYYYLVLLMSYIFNEKSREILQSYSHYKMILDSIFATREECLW